MFLVILGYYEVLNTKLVQAQKVCLIIYGIIFLMF